MRRALHCDLARFQQSVQSSGFIARFWYQFEFKVQVAVFLTPTELIRVHLVNIAIFIDRSDVALGATSLLIGYQGSAWTVPTPPVAHHSQPVRSATSSSLRSSGGDAVEIQ